MSEVIAHQLLQNQEALYLVRTYSASSDSASLASHFKAFQGSSSLYFTAC